MGSTNLNKAILSVEELRQINDWLPDGYRFGTWANCFYCGTEPTCSEHVVPFSMLSFEDAAKRHSVGVTTPACNECNSVLSAYYFDTLQERVDYLNKRLRRRYSKLLHIEAWQDWELNELKCSLRSYVHSKQQERQIAVKRCTWQFKPEFTDLFEQAYKEAKATFPANERFHTFMRPKWI